MGVLVERVVADVEVGGVDQAGRGGEGDQLARLRRRHRQRLLADDVAAGGEDGLRLRQVEVVGRGDVDRVDRRVVEERLERGVRARDAERLGPGRATFRGAAEHAADPDADAAQGFDVDRADEARADHGRADIGDPPHATFTHWLVRASASRLDGDLWSATRPIPPRPLFGLSPLPILLSHVKCKSRTRTAYDRGVMERPTAVPSGTSDGASDGRSIGARPAGHGPLPDEALDALVTVLDEIRLGPIALAGRARDADQPRSGDRRPAGRRADRARPGDRG